MCSIEGLKLTLNFAALCCNMRNNSLSPTSIPLKEQNELDHNLAVVVLSYIVLIHLQHEHHWLLFKLTAQSAAPN